jgi:N-acetylglucosamine malate deacetylase 1
MILILVAHPDDEVLGCGGTIAKYAEEGEDVVSVILSDGDPINNSKDFIIKRRKESISAGKILGINDTVFMGLPDRPFGSNLNNKSIKGRIENIITKLNPRIIFTHSPDDPHPVHASIARLAKEIAGKNIPLYTFTIGSPLKVKQRHMPRLYINISETYNKKKQALREFHSQEHYLIYYKFVAFLSNKIAGMHSHNNYAEVFYKW